MTNETKVFSQEELSDLGKSCNILTLEALEKGDYEKAKYWAARSEETKEYVHDMYVAWVPALLSVIHERLGEDQYVPILRDSIKGFAEPLSDSRAALLEEGGMKAWIEFLSDVWRQNCGQFEVTEDDEKFIFKQRPCGSGGQMIDRGMFDGIFGNRRFEKAGPHTFSQENMPLYCGHCPWVHMALPIKKSGAPLWCHDLENPFPRKAGDPCIHYIYKDPANIPAEYYEMVGCKKE
jgi:hypothetical protein